MFSVQAEDIFVYCDAQHICVSASDLIFIINEKATTVGSLLGIDLLLGCGSTVRSSVIIINVIFVIF